MSENIKVNAWEAAEEIVNLRRELVALRADIHAHEQINRQLIEDKRRLDWLDHNAIPWTWMSPEKIDGLGPIVVTWKSNRTLRAAIDAARKEAQP